MLLSSIPMLKLCRTFIASNLFNPAPVPGSVPQNLNDLLNNANLRLRLSVRLHEALRNHFRINNLLYLEAKE